MADRLLKTFAENGETNPVPDTSTGEELSIESGWSQAYSRKQDEAGYRYIDRPQHNRLWQIVTGILKQIQDDAGVQWFDDIAYPAFKKVHYIGDGNDYISIQSVPAGTLPTNATYWKPWELASDADVEDGTGGGLVSSDQIGLRADSFGLDGRAKTAIPSIDDHDFGLAFANSDAIGYDSSIFGSDSIHVISTRNSTGTRAGQIAWNSSAVAFRAFIDPNWFSWEELALKENQPVYYDSTGTIIQSPIVQMGFFNTGTIGNEAPGSESFNVAFPTACNQVIIGSNGGTILNNSVEGFRVVSFSTTGFTWISHWQSRNNSEGPIRYIAIGY